MRQTGFREGELAVVRGFTRCLPRRRAMFGFLRDALLILSKISRLHPLRDGNFMAENLRRTVAHPDAGAFPL
jgi:hypothetical protein